MNLPEGKSSSFLSRQNWCALAAARRGEGSCGCGVAYVKAGVFAEAAVKANPGKSDRAIAEEIGTSPTTVGKARKQLSNGGQLEKRTGKDGKTRKMPKARGEGPQAAKFRKTREAIRDAVARGDDVVTKSVAENLGVSVDTVERAALARQAAKDALAEYAKSENIQLAKAEASFSDKSKLTISDAIRIYTARLDKSFQAKVGEEVRKLIAAADDATRKENVKLGKKTSRSTSCFSRGRSSLLKNIERYCGAGHPVTQLPQTRVPARSIW